MFIIETGVGKFDAVSYVDLENADQYIEEWYGDVDAWLDLDDTEKKRCLLKATRFIDSHNFKGRKTYADQALAFPRSQMGMIDGHAVSAWQVPRQIIQATVEAALREAQGQKLMPDQDGGTIQSEARTIGPIVTQVQYASPKKTGQSFEEIRALLKPYLASGKVKEVLRSAG